jgi:hypothetical protein
MALVLYKIEESGAETEVDNTTNKITAFHDTSDGTYSFNRFYITNEPAETGYQSIEVSLLKDGIKDGPISLDGVVYHLLATNSDGDLPETNLWENLPYNNSLNFPPLMAGETSRYYFVLRTYVPKGKGATYISNASLAISAVEVI